MFIDIFSITISFVRKGVQITGENNDKNIVESTSGNIFIVKNNIIKTPPLEDGCVDGIIRRILLRQGDLVFHLT